MRTVPSLSLMPPAFVTSSTHSWMPSVCRFEVTFWLPVWDWVNPIVNVFVCVAGALLPDALDAGVGVVPPHAAATSPATASAAPAERRRHEDDDEQIERDRAEPDREPAVARDERHEDVEDADARGGVEDERDDVCEDERDDEPGRPIVERAQGAVLREEGERRGPRGEPADRRDAERGVRAEAAGPRELPEEEVHLGAGGLRDGGAGRGRHGRAQCDRGLRARRDRDDRGLKRRVRDRKMVRGVVERTAEDGEREERARELERPGGSPPGRLAALRSGLGGTLLVGRDGGLRRVQVFLLLCLPARATRRERAAHENKVRTHQKALSRADFLARS